VEVRFTEDSIGIYEGKKEIVYWYINEWEEDSDVVFSIANAIKLAYTDPEELKKLLKK